jgi:type 1 glutamine amidotransferase
MKMNHIKLPWVFCLLASLCCLRAQDKPADAFPVRGLSIAAPRPDRLDKFIKFVDEELAPRGVNTLILRVDYGFQFVSHPELSDGNGLSRADAGRLVEVCKKNHIKIIPLIDLLGHQSWDTHPGNLLKTHPEFDETPWVKFPEKYKWPNEDRLYCKSYCPLHPGVHDVVFALVDEVCDAFEAEAFHAGMDEVFYIGEDKCPRCGGKDKSELFAGELKKIRDHLALKNRKLWIWGDRLLDGKTTGLGEWEASENDTFRAIDMIPRDITICDWHYVKPEPTAAYFAMKGFPVVTCPWNNPKSGVLQVRDMAKTRDNANGKIRGNLQGIVETVWSGADSFIDEYYGLMKGATPKKESQAQCFIQVFEEMSGHLQKQGTPDRKRNLLIIGQSIGYQHDSVSSAMATLYRLGRETGLWDTCFKTDCTAITKKPLKWGAKNLDAFDAVMFFTDGDLSMDDSQKADLLNFVREEGKGFIGVHSATITFTTWPEYGEMIGGYFDGHPWGEFNAPLIVEDPAFPGLAHFPHTFTLKDEIYQIRNYSRDNVRVLLRLDPKGVDLTKKDVHRADGDFAVAWARNYGKGRVLYNGLGHGQDVWDRADIQKMWVEMIQWAMGLKPGDATPRPLPK